MGPAGYKVVDFVKSGGALTLWFLVVTLWGLTLAL